MAGAVVTKRQEEVNRQYHMRAREIDFAQGTAPGETGPLKKKLDEYGQSGRVLAPVVGAFAEVSTDTYALVDLISSVLADDHCSYYTESPSEAKAVFTQRLYNSFGLSAHLGWARLLIDRYRDLVKTPISQRHNQSRNNYSTPDDEDAFGHENYHNPDSFHHTH